MKHEEEPLPLSALRTTPPLRESDYAAIRARVKAEMAEKKHRGWWWQFMVAAAVIAIIAVFTFRRPQPQPLTRSRHGGTTLSPLRGARVIEQPVVVRPAVYKVAKHTRKHTRHAVPAVQTAMRIEMRTADPDVRIIWIVKPEPKEKS